MKSGVYLIDRPVELASNPAERLRGLRAHSFSSPAECRSMVVMATCTTSSDLRRRTLSTPPEALTPCSMRVVCRFERGALSAGRRPRSSWSTFLRRNKRPQPQGNREPPLLRSRLRLSSTHTSKRPRDRRASHVARAHSMPRGQP